jgi:hypothetical protein
VSAEQAIADFSNMSLTTINANGTFTSRSGDTAVAQAAPSWRDWRLALA